MCIRRLTTSFRLINPLSHKYIHRVAVWPCGRVAVWPCGRVAVWPCGRVAVWPGCVNELCKNGKCASENDKVDGQPLGGLGNKG